MSHQETQTRCEPATATTERHLTRDQMQTIRDWLAEMPFERLIWLDLDASIRRSDPEEERKARRMRRLIKQESPTVSFRGQLDHTVMREAGWSSGRGDAEHVLYFMLPPAATPKGSGSWRSRSSWPHGSCLTCKQRSALAATNRFGKERGVSFMGETERQRPSGVARPAIPLAVSLWARRGQ
jgi:hypothetical protein